MVDETVKIILIILKIVKNFIVFPALGSQTNNIFKIIVQNNIIPYLLVCYSHISQKMTLTPSPLKS